VHANWKQRIDQPYVFVEFIGSYTETGGLLPLVHQAMRDRGLEPDGPPFALFFDDPGGVPADRLRSRACVPVEREVEPGPALSFDSLPSTTVVYAFASGPYPEVPRAYPALYVYMKASGWVENGPIRETYLVSPTEVRSFEELRTEIQIPVMPAR
jgi:AraC family transcriptional regulator